MRQDPRGTFRPWSGGSRWSAGSWCWFGAEIAHRGEFRAAEEVRSLSAFPLRHVSADGGAGRTLNGRGEAVGERIGPASPGASHGGRVRPRAEGRREGEEPPAVG